MIQTLTCSENKARQEQNSAEDVRDVTKKGPRWRFEGQWAPVTSPSTPPDGARGTPVRPHRRPNRNGTSVKARTPRWRAQQEDHESAKNRNLIFTSQYCEDSDDWLVWFWISSSDSEWKRALSGLSVETVTVKIGNPHTRSALGSLLLDHVRLGGVYSCFLS